MDFGAVVVTITLYRVTKLTCLNAFIEFNERIKTIKKSVHFVVLFTWRTVRRFDEINIPKDSLSHK